MRIPFVLVLSIASAAAAGACAPRMNKTHFARWAEQDQQRREENAADEKVDAWLRTQAGVATPADEKKADKAPGSVPKTATHVQANQASGARETPPIATSKTSTRAAKQGDKKEESEDEAIY